MNLNIPGFLGNSFAAAPPANNKRGRMQEERNASADRFGGRKVAKPTEIDSRSSKPLAPNNNFARGRPRDRTASPRRVGQNIGNAVSPFGESKQSLLPRPASLPRFHNHGFQEAATGFNFNVDAEDEINPTKEDKFSSFSKLYVGNLPRGVKEQEVRDLFKEFCGEEKVDLFLDSNKGFAFIKLPYRHQALAAKEKLDNTPVNGRNIRIRFAKHSGALVVENLGPCVSNEALYRAFREFGELEKAVVITNEMNQSVGKGKVFYKNKHNASFALDRVNSGMFFLGSTPRPIFCKELQHQDDEDGLMNESIPKSHQFYQERNAPPRFAIPGTPEFIVGLRWKELFLEFQKEKQELKEKFYKNCEIMQEELQETLKEMEVMRIREDIERQRHEMMFLEKRLGSKFGRRNVLPEPENELFNEPAVSEEMDLDESIEINPPFTNGFGTVARRWK